MHWAPGTKLPIRSDGQGTPICGSSISSHCRSPRLFGAASFHIYQTTEFIVMLAIIPGDRGVR